MVFVAKGVEPFFVRTRRVRVRASTANFFRGAAWLASWFIGECRSRVFFSFFLGKVYKEICENLRLSNWSK